MATATARTRAALEVIGRPRPSPGRCGTPSHCRATKGGCPTFLNSFGSFEEWGSWQLVHVILFASMPRCAAAKLLSPVEWHWSHSSKTVCERSFGFPAACGWWQVRQSSTGSCFFSVASRSRSAWWHDRHRSGAFARSRLFTPAVCGLWHFVHSPAAKTACTLFDSSACFSFGWHFRQSAFWSVTSSPGAFEPCGVVAAEARAVVERLVAGRARVLEQRLVAALQSFHPAATSSFGPSPPCGAWHALHFPSSTGLWVCAFMKRLSASGWHPKQSLSWREVIIPFRSEPCGSWQVVQSPSANGMCGSLWVPACRVFA